MNPRFRFGRARDVACYLLAAFLGAVSLADIYYRCRSEIFFPDEVYNLDPILTFFRTGDYTSASQGNHPFDPVLSSGILATWLNGVAYVAGGNLFRARLVSALVQLGIVTYLAYRMLRVRGVAARDALVVALGAWTVLILVGCHDLRIINAGELWGFIYLAAGCFFARRNPLLATFIWGLGTWLAKITYLPFSAAFVVALVLAETFAPRDEPDGHANGRIHRLLVNCAQLGLAFITPLLLWMALIVLRYDFATLGRWLSSYVTFVAKHAADVRVADLPVYQNWRFDPAWNAMPLLGFGWRITASYLAPLVAGAFLAVVYFPLRLLGVIRATLHETLLLAAACSAAAAAVTWFFTVDPTQWGRHLMPAIYVAIAVGLYCGAEIHRAVVTRPAAAIAFGVLAYAACLTGAYYAYGATRAYTARHGWILSYARNCRGTAVLAPPCQNNGTLDLFEKLGKEWCGPATEMFSPTDYCKLKNRRRIVEYAIDILGDVNAPELAIHTAGYLIPLIQYYDYQTRAAFVEDIGALICDRPIVPLHERLLDLGMDRRILAEACTVDTSQPSH